MRNVYYKTKKTSDTGMKIQALCDRADASVEEINAFVDSLGADRKYLMSGWCIMGTGISGLKMDNPDPKVWKPFKGFPGYYSPRRSSKEGKALAKKISEFHRVERDEISESIGLNDFLKRPGLSIRDSEFFGIEVAAEWNHQMPSDCVEITASEYTQL